MIKLPGRRLWQAIHRIERQLMGQQDEINTLTTQAGEIGTDLATARTTLQGEIDQLAAANPGVDITGLQAAIAPLDQAAKDLAALKPTPTA